MNIYDVGEYRQALQIPIKQLPDRKSSFLVTGATGLIGSCIVDSLLYADQVLDRNYSVFILGRNKHKMADRFSYYRGQNLQFIVQDISEPLNLDVDVDFIIHAASNADPRSYALQPVETISGNVLGMINVLNYCREHTNTRLLFTSTFEVYGNKDGENYFSEGDIGIIDYNAIRSGYPEGKRVCELLLRSYVDEYGIDGVIARLSSVYGPTMSATDNKAHAQFIRNALNHQDIVLKSKGEQKRTYCYVIDTVSGILKVLFDGKVGEAYNIANSKSIATIAEVADTVSKIAGTKVTFDLPSDLEKKGFSKPQNSILNVEKVERLGWHGLYTLEDGLKETIDILKELSC